MEPTIVFYNGDIHTMEKSNPIVEAVAIYQKRVVAVGKNDEIRRLAGPETKKIDLKGKTVIPGLTDAHVHFVSYALTAQQVNLDGANSLEEALGRVKKKTEKAKKGDWILGRGWDKNLWEGGGFPKKEDLDKIAKNNPVALNCKDGHVMWVNSAALKLGGITKDTPQPPGGEIEKDKVTGEPTGILKEEAQSPIRKITSQPTFEEMTKATVEAIRDYQRVGLTAITDSEGCASLRVFQDLLERGELGLRISMMFPTEELDAALKFGIQAGFGNDKLRIAALKVVADGALGSQTAAMLKGYENNPENKGILRHTEEELEGFVNEATRGGLGVAVHCIGDRANRVILDAFEANRKKVKTNGRVRLRVEHAQHLTEKDVKRFGELDVIASMQPIHIALDMDIADHHLGKRGRWAYPFRTLIDTGAHLAFGSDSPVEKHNPFLGIYTAVTRKRNPEYPKEGWYPEERISVEEAVRAYTLGGAHASGEEDVRGTIAPGKLADMVVISKNIFKVPEDEIMETEAVMTVFDGKIVYEKRT